MMTMEDIAALPVNDFPINNGAERGTLATDCALLRVGEDGVTAFTEDGIPAQLHSCDTTALPATRPSRAHSSVLVFQAAEPGADRRGAPPRSPWGRGIAPDQAPRNIAARSPSRPAPFRVLPQKVRHPTPMGAPYGDGER